MGIRKETIVYVDKELTKKARKNYKKENPDKRLCFRLRYPDFLKEEHNGFYIHGVGFIKQNDIDCSNERGN